MSTGLYRVASAIPHGVTARAVHVDVHVAQGLPSFTIVGVPDQGCRETRDRVRAAVINAGYRWPSIRITVAVSPSPRIPPTAVLDLPIAVGLLVASGQLQAPDDEELLGGFGELGLDGSVRPVTGHLPILCAVQGDRVFAPPMRIDPVPFQPGAAAVIELRHLNQLDAAIKQPCPVPHPPNVAPGAKADHPTGSPDQLNGLSALERALMIAIAGGHHTLIVGSQGPDRSGVLQALTRLVPDLDDSEWHEQILIQSAAGADLDDPAAYRRNRPVRVVDPGWSLAHIVGGMSSTMRPGEFSLAHQGLLVMDNLHLLADQVLQVLVSTLDARSVRVARAARSVELPAHFQLVAAVPRCLCGAPTTLDCVCSESARARFLSKLRGGLLERIEVVIDLDRLSGFDPLSPIRDLDITRIAHDPISDEVLPTVAPVDPHARQALDDAVTGGRLSHRGMASAWRVADTIQRLTQTAGPIGLDVMLEALHLRYGNPDGAPYLHLTPSPR